MRQTNGINYATEKNSIVSLSMKTIATKGENKEVCNICKMQYVACSFSDLMGDVQT